MQNDNERDIQSPSGENEENQEEGTVEETEATTEGNPAKPQPEE